MPAAKFDPKDYYLSKQINDRLLKTYGITYEEYQRKLESQGGVCAICGEAETQMVRRKTIRRLCVDHNARTGQVRSLLCAQCNLAIGNFKENPDLFQRAADYLRRWNMEDPPEGG